DKDGARKYAWETSWGVSTRLIGALIMAHGDQRGLVLPPKVAPIQVIVIPIAVHKEGVIDKCNEVIAQLDKAGIRVEGDFTDNSAGWKFNQWEMKGVPIRMEIGPRDIENGVVTVSRRDTCEKSALPLDNIEASTSELLTQIQQNMFIKSKKFRDSHIIEAHNMKEIKEALDGGNFAKVVWDQDPACEARVKQEVQATTRVMLEEEPLFQEECSICGAKSDKNIVTIIARAY
ncbi:MAG: His/Gly/Thr/Pro-type tRNA ligase C-terminal domain-containing protein, partial [Clostridia bacterium]